jgi:hypothetical protein
MFYEREEKRSFTSAELVEFATFLQKQVLILS